MRSAITALTAAMVVLASGVLAVMTTRRAPMGKPEIVIPLGHAGQVYSIAWSPDGKSLATAGADATVKVWAPGSGELLRTISGFEAPVDVAWNAEIAVDGPNAGPDQAITLWNPQSGTLARTVAKSSDPIETFAWSPDRTMFAAIVKQGRRSDNYVRIWRATGDVIATVGDYADSIRAIAWTPDSKTVVAAGATINLYRADSGSLLRAIRDSNGDWNIWEHAAISVDNKTLAVSGNGWLYVWQLDTGALQWTRHDYEHYFASLAWSPDGGTLASGGLKDIRLWQAGTGALLRTFDAQAKECVYAVAWSPDGKTIAASGDKGTVALWHADSGALLRALPGHPNSVSSLAWSPDGRTLASGSYDHTIKLWNTASGTLARSIAGHSGEIVSVAWSPDGGKLASGSRDRTAKLWDPSSGALLHTFAESGVVAWRPDGKVLAAADGSKVKLWQAASGDLFRDLDAPRADLASLSWSPDGQKLAAGNGSILTWNVDSKNSLAASFSPPAPTRLVAFSPDGKILAAAGQERGARIGLLQASTLDGPQGISYPAKPRAMVWSPDGRLLATGHDDGTIQIWRGDSGAPVRSLAGHSGPVEAVAWSPDGQTLASGGADATIRMWHAAGGELESVTTLLPDGEWITVLPNSLRYSSSPRGDDYAKMQFGSAQTRYPLSRYRSRLKADDVRAFASQPMPAIRPDYLSTAAEVARENPKAGGLWVLLYIGAAVLMIVAPARTRWVLCGATVGIGLAAGISWMVVTAPREPANVPGAAAVPKIPAEKNEPKNEPKVNPRDGLRYVWVPPGSFLMGCSPGDSDCPSEGTYGGLHDEGHGFTVTLSKGFWMGATPVTVGAFKRFAKATSQEMPAEAYIFAVINPGWSDETQPMINVTRNDANSYCEWAGMRLPTEAEWERAARGGSKEPRYGKIDDIAWWRENTLAADGSQVEGPKPVGQKQPNAYGLYDMLGNVREWVADWYGANYYETGPRVDPQGPSTGTQRVIRGASWNSDAEIYLRVSTRYSSAPDGRDSRGQADAVDVGFRCAGN